MFIISNFQFFEMWDWSGVGISHNSLWVIFGDESVPGIQFDTEAKEILCVLVIKSTKHSGLAKFYRAPYWL